MNLNYLLKTGLISLAVILQPIIAFSQTAENVDLLVNFDSSENISIEKPFKSEMTINFYKLDEVLKELTDPKGFYYITYTGNNLAVVIMSENWSAKPEEEKGSDIEKIENIIKKYGFKKVIIKQAVSSGEPIILREQ